MLVGRSDFYLERYVAYPGDGTSVIDSTSVELASEGKLSGFD